MIKANIKSRSIITLKERYLFFKEGEQIRQDESGQSTEFSAQGFQPEISAEGFPAEVPPKCLPKSPV